MSAMAPLHTMLFDSMEYSTATKAAKAQRSALDFPESWNFSKFDLEDMCSLDPNITRQGVLIHTLI